MSGQGTKGSLPTEIGYLTKLELLIMENASISGTLPSELGKLAQLTSLILVNWGQTELHGTIPSQLGDLPNLGKHLCVHICALMSFCCLASAFETLLIVITPRISCNSCYRHHWYPSQHILQWEVESEF